MSLATSRAKVVIVLESVTGIENVRMKPRLPTERDEHEETLFTQHGGAQRLTIYLSVSSPLAGLDQHEEADVTIGGRVSERVRGFL